MKKSIFWTCISISFFTFLVIIGFHIMLYVQNNDISSYTEQITQKEQEIKKIQTDSAFMTYERNQTFLKQLVRNKLTPYIQELFTLTSSPITLASVQLGGTGGGQNKTLQGKITISTPADFNAVGQYIKKLKSSINFTTPYTTSISETNNNQGGTLYTLPITLQLQQFNN